LKVEEADEA
jgi:hypothetical protein